MWELRRVKRYGYVNLGRYGSRDAALVALTHITRVAYFNGDRFNGEDGFTYVIQYV